MSGQDDIRSGNTVPLSACPPSSRDSNDSSIDSDDTSMGDGCLAYRLVSGNEVFDSLDDVASDIHCLSKQQKNCLDEIMLMKNEIRLLNAVFARLEGNSVAHEMELAVHKGEHVWGTREQARRSALEAAAKRMNGDVFPISLPMTKDTS